VTDPGLEPSLHAALTEVARACRILEMEGHGDMTLGHLSFGDPESRGFWLKQNRIGLGEVLGPGDFVLMSAGFRAGVPSPATRLKRHGQVMTSVHWEHSWNYFCRKLKARGESADGLPVPLYG
jgi:hypothetical protein